MTRRLPLLLALSACLAAVAQSPLMCTSSNDVNLVLDLERLWDYNRYEGSRWGMGLSADFPMFGDGELPVAEQRRMSLSAWAGYGVRDKAWKYGAEASLSFPHGLVDKVYLQAKNDLERAGSRALRNYDPWEVWDNPGFFSAYFLYVRRAALGLVASTHHHRLDLSYRLSQESVLCGDFDASAILLHELRLTWTLRQHFTLDLIGGSQLDASRSPLYLRALAQYSQRFDERKWGQMALFAQAGYATLDAPRQRWFDLGGTYDAPLFFRNTFLTAEPSEYYDQAFALAFLSYHSPAFYHSRFSNPRLFLQVGAQVGLDSTPLSELGLGLDRIVRWGILDLGVAAAYQLYPEHRFAILSVATLIFE